VTGNHYNIKPEAMGGAQSTEPIPWPPAFANGLESPEYTVLEKNEEYEVREYKASSWVTTADESMDLDSKNNSMFWKLFKYIDKGNQTGEKIAMTCPVLIKVVPGQGPACESKFTMSFFLPPRDEAYPKANDETVFHSELPAIKVYIRSFSGFAPIKDKLREAEALAKALPESAEYDKDFWTFAGYDSPFKLMNRHNEIWFIAKSETVSE